MSNSIGTADYFIVHVGEQFRYSETRYTSGVVIYFNGRDMGGKIIEIARSADGSRAIWRKAGHAGWAGHGMTEYNPTEYWMVGLSGDMATIQRVMRYNARALTAWKRELQ